jgi:hypothetical protein
LEKPGTELLRALDLYTDAVMAQVRNPSTVTAEDGPEPTDWLGRPIFILGIHRSGTTLVQNLLDGHPDLLVLPSEGTWLTNLLPRFQSMAPSERSDAVVSEWVRRLVKPQAQPPFWTLGRTDDHGAPYLEFARCATGAFRKSGPLLARHEPFGPLLAVVAGLHHVLHQSATPQYWVDKTPLNEFHIQTLRRTFPSAKFIHVVRDPRAIAASRVELEQNALGRRPRVPRLSIDIRKSFRIALGNRSRTDYHLVHYEALIERPQDVMDGVRHFLDVSPNPTLLCPTVGGRPTVANASHELPDTPGKIVRDSEPPFDTVLTGAEIGLVDAVTGTPARALGYPIGPGASVRGLIRYFRSR